MVELAVRRGRVGRLAAVLPASGSSGPPASDPGYSCRSPVEPPGVLNYWAHWDGGWYASIATHGYFGTNWPASANFFPLYPLLLHVASLAVGGPAVWGVAISLVAALCALYFLHELARDCFGRRAAQASTLSLAFFPTAFYLNAVYTEALFLALATGAIWAARLRGDFVIAGLLGCLAAGTRNVGVFLVVPLAHEWLRRREKAGLLGLAAIAFVPIGLLGYMFWLWRWSSHPLLFQTVVRRTWGRQLTDPVATIEHAWTAARNGAVWAVHPERVFGTTSPSPPFEAMRVFDLTVLVLLVVLLVAGVFVLPPGMLLYALIAVMVPVLTPPQIAPLGSLPRYALAAFPLFFVLGRILASSRVALGLWLVASCSLGGLLTLYFTSWRWVG